MSKENPFDKAFENAFNRAEVTPPDTAWQAIETALPKKPNRKVAIWWFTAAASVAALLTFGWVQFNTNATKAELAQEQLQDSIIQLKNEIQRLNQQVAQQNNTSFSGGPKTSQPQENNSSLNLQTIAQASSNKEFNVKNNHKEETTHQSELLASNTLKSSEFTLQNFDSTLLNGPENLADRIAFNGTPIDSLISNNNEKALLKNSIAQALKSGNLPQINTEIDSTQKASTSPLINNQGEEVASLGSTQKTEQLLEEPTKDKTKNSQVNWLVGGSVAPNVLAMSSTRGTLYNFEADQSETLKQFESESVAGSDSKSVVAVQTAIDFGVEFADRWLVSSGLGYVSWQNTSESLQPVANLGANTAYSNATIDTTTIAQNLEFFQLPIQAHYWLVNKRLKFGLGAGINALLGGTYKYKSESNLSNTVLLDVQESSGALYQLNPMVSSKLWYKLSNAVQVQFEPSFGVGILPRDLYFTSRPQRSFAFKTGLLVNL